MAELFLNGNILGFDLEWEDLGEETRRREKRIGENFS